MEANKTEVPAQTALPETMAENEGPQSKGFLKNSIAKDEYMGDKIKDLADKGGFICAIGALIIGIVLWSRTSDIAGLLIGLVVTAVGIAVSIILTMVIRSYGDMLNMTVEQMKMMKKMEERRAAELAFWGAPEMHKPAEAPAQETAQVQPQTPLESLPEDDDSWEIEEETPLSDSTKPIPEEQSFAAAASGIVVDRVNKTVRYPSRDAMGESCPICGRRLRREYDACFYCGCKLVFSNEEKLAGDRKAVELLRTLMYQ